MCEVAWYLQDYCGPLGGHKSFQNYLGKRLVPALRPPCSYAYVDEIERQQQQKIALLTNIAASTIGH